MYAIHCFTKRLRLTAAAYSLLLICICCCACSAPEKPQPDAAYLGEIEHWRTDRVKRLKAENGWLNLAGLYWLREGPNTFGADPSNDVVFPDGKADAFLGSMIREGNTVTASILPDARVLHKLEPFTDQMLVADVDGNPTIMSHKSLRWHIIRRGEQVGVRLRDLLSPNVKQFSGIDYFPVDPAWRVEAKFELYKEPRMLAIPNVMGTVNEQPVFGELVFTIENTTYRLIPTGDSDLFVVFGDATNGSDTYGGGRFLVVPPPDANGATILDFNYAYNPPCAFTDFATCPLPPEENKLGIKISAGEKAYGEAH